MLRGSKDLVSPISLDREHFVSLQQDEIHSFLDVEEVQHTFNLKETPVAEVIDGLTAATSNGVVFWDSFFAFFSGLADLQPHNREANTVMRVAKSMFNIFDEERREEVNLCKLASGLSVSLESILMQGVRRTVPAQRKHVSGYLSLSD